ncbi:hypothetical protein L596_027113 [Steinernema carpocapsae]|uniref:Uncharacterized protein n=1 Tax=Steinernema carpocapsae TaxID=34508 RepID=A0A4V6XVQ3_STECR|nr:hypothetical protein L596_027113 [Steinernema carpocapsae]
MHKRRKGAFRPEMYRHTKQKTRTASSVYTVPCSERGIAIVGFRSKKRELRLDQCPRLDLRSKSKFDPNILATTKAKGRHVRLCSTTQAKSKIISEMPKIHNLEFLWFCAYRRPLLTSKSSSRLMLT